MFRASLFPSSGEEDSVLLHMLFCTGCARCGRVELGLKVCAPCEVYRSNSATLLHTTTASTTSVEHHMQ